MQSTLCKNIDDTTLKNGSYYTNGSTTGTFPTGFSKFGVFTITERGSERFYKYTDPDGKQADRLYTSANTWTAWNVKVSRVDVKAGRNTVTLTDGYATINHNCGFSGTNYTFMAISSTSRRIPVFAVPVDGNSAQVCFLYWNADGTIKEAISGAITINWIAVAF